MVLLRYSQTVTGFVGRSGSSAPNPCGAVDCRSHSTQTPTVSSSGNLPSDVHVVRPLRFGTRKPAHDLSLDDPPTIVGAFQHIKVVAASRRPIVPYRHKMGACPYPPVDDGCDDRAIHVMVDAIRDLRLLYVSRNDRVETLEVLLVASVV